MEIKWDVMLGDYNVTEIVNTFLGFLTTLLEKYLPDFLLKVE